MPHAEIPGITLYYEETGTGYPVVFVHEFGADTREWEAQVRHFSRFYRCVTYCARGYKPSAVPPDAGQYGWDFAVEDLAGLMTALGIDRAHLVGLSMGGYAVLQFGLRYPGRASAIVAAGAGTGSDPSDRAAWLAEVPAAAKAFLDQGMAAVAEGMGHSPTRIQLKRKDPRGWAEFMDHLREHSADGMANTMAQYQGKRPSLHDSQAAFGAMAVPVLLAVGDEDGPCLATNLMLKQAIPGAGLWVCPNTGHAINLEEPAAFNAQVDAFFSAVERGRWPSRGSQHD